MIKKYSIVATPFLLSEIFKKSDFSLKDAFKNIIGFNYLYFFNSATTSLFLTLEVLKEFSDKKEVIVPAYSASSIIYAIKKAKLIPKLCDISAEDFNFKVDDFLNLVSSKTLCAILVYLFGITSEKILDLKNFSLNIYFIEDCAQAFGSKIGDRFVGANFDFGIFSFNKGKNTPTYNGGAVGFNSKDFALILDKKIAKTNLKTQNVFICLLEIIFLYFFVNPYIYGLLYPVISKLKEKTYSKDFSIGGLNKIKLKLIFYFLKNLENLSRKRYLNGKYILDNLKDYQNIILPKVSNNTKPAFNRFPIIFKDLKTLDKVRKALESDGFETSRMYEKPLHWIFDLGYKKDDFKCANFLAQHILTIPIHPLIKEKDLAKMVEVIKKNL
ncbi:MAG: DegT/DnrJ/EryC1/StrS family aminotransferase [Candidatus Omnitrophica bacterium]|nr:DegT/DnrJ/EryC1/StrS family aminotransferase [Candidatus Omnitrophota bacterium]MCM8832019.1 DegT/DnrJ/EryC1/StrS family aminotransferase [Candidatus Omnitrophota bacterium]